MPLEFLPMHEAVADLVLPVADLMLPVLRPAVEVLAARPAAMVAHWVAALHRGLEMELERKGVTSVETCCRHPVEQLRLGRKATLFSCVWPPFVSPEGCKGWPITAVNQQWIHPPVL